MYKIHDTGFLKEQMAITSPDRVMFVPKQLEWESDNVHLYVVEHEKYGGLLAFWTQSTFEGTGNNHLVFAGSRDGGKTWSAPLGIGDMRGRVYDARVFDGDIYVLMQQGKDPSKGTITEYHMFKSTDCGESFTDIAVLPFRPTFDVSCYYGTMEILHDGRMIVYVYYDREDETRVTFATSGDMGVTWSSPAETRFAKRIRNMQLIAFENSYFCFGRSGSHGEDAEQGHIIVYCSADGVNWDEGHYLKMRTASAGAYSNAILVHDGDKTRLLYHASHAYYRSRTNVFQWFIDAQKE